MAVTPFGFGSNMAGLGFQIPRAARRAAPPPTLTEEEERSLLSSVLGGLQYAGETLDKPGAAVRGVMAGEYDQLLNLIPFSDAMGITTPSERTSGRDLLEMYAGAPKNVPGFVTTGWEDSLWDTAGFLAEVALDPLMLVSGPGKAITKAGQAVEKGTARQTKNLTKALKLYKEAGTEGTEQLGRVLGRTPTDKAAEIREGLRGVVGFGMPWGKPMVTLGAGSKTAARAVEMYYGNPLSTAIRSVFSSTVGRIYDSAAQKARDFQVSKLNRLKDNLSSLAPALRESSATLPRLFKSFMKHHDEMGDQKAVNMFRDLERELAESPFVDGAGASRRLEPKDVQAAMNQLDRQGALADGWQAAADGFDRQMSEYVDAMMQTKDKIANEARDMGVNLAELDDVFIKHMARRPSNRHVLARGERGKEADDMARLFAVGTSYAKGRGSVFRHFPEGTPGFNKTVRNNVFRGLVDSDAIGDVTDVVTLRGATGRLRPGAVVHAADRQNFGRIVSIKGNTAEVYFVSREGVEATKRVPLKQLTKVSAGKGKIPMVKLSKEKHSALLRETMGLAEDEFTDYTRENLQKLYLLRNSIEPGLDKAVQDGLLDTAGRSRELDWWRNGLDEGTAEAMNRQAGVSQGEVVVDYINKLPTETARTGLFDRALVTDWHDYMESLFTAMSTMSSAHSFLHGDKIVSRLAGGAADLKETDNLVPLSQAWGDAKLSAQGFRKFASDFGENAKLDEKDLANLLEKPGEQLWVDPRVASTLKSYVESMQPKVTNKLLQLSDKITALYKGSLTTPFPAFHARNSAAGIWAAWAEGDISIFELIPAVGKAILHARDPGAGHLKFLDDFVAGGGLGGGMSRMIDTVGEEAAAAGGVPAQGLFKGIWKDWTDPARWKKGSRLANIDPLNTRGVSPRGIVDAAGDAVLDAAGNPQIQENLWSSAGAKGYKYVEYLNRAPYYEVLRQKGMTHAQAMHKVVRSQFDYNSLAPFEKTVARRLIPFYCVPIDCEILTRAGWKTYDQLEVGEDVMGYDVESHTQQWTPLEDVATFDYDGEMFAIKKSKCGAEWLSTPNHRWPVRRMTSNGVHHRKIVRSYQLRSNHAVPYTAPMTGWPTSCRFSVRDAAVIGWLVTDGHIRKKDWAIYQSEKKFTNVIRELLGEDSLKEYAHPDTGVVRFTVRASYVNELKGKGFRSPDDLPAIIGSLNEECAHAMWDAMYLADGTTAARNADFLAAMKRPVRDGAQMLTQMLGNHMHLTKWGGYIARGKWCKLAGSVSIMHYKGKIWCPKTGTGTWVMRRNGKVIITGNTWSRKNIPYTLSKIMNRPGGRTAQTIRAVNQSSTGDEYTPRFLREGVAVRMGGDERAAGFLKATGLPVEDLNLAIFQGNLPIPSMRTAEKMISMAHPVGVAALEAMTGRNLYFGRDTKNMEGPAKKAGLPGATALDFLLMKSPASRFANEIWGGLDARKTTGQKLLNFLTGVKFGNYDLPKHKALELAKALEEQLADLDEIRERTDYYVPKDKMAKLPPERQESIRRSLKLRRALYASVKKLREDAEKEEAAR